MKDEKKLARTIARLLLDVYRQGKRDGGKAAVREFRKGGGKK